MSLIRRSVRERVLLGGTSSAPSTERLSDIDDAIVRRALVENVDVS
jgi:hypothetical protein